MRIGNNRNIKLRQNQIKSIMGTKNTSVTLDGFATIEMLKNKLHRVDFHCTEDVRMEGFSGTFSVQAMYDGNIYVTEKARRKRNRPLFRQDNSSLSLGRNGRYYFIFSLAEERIEELPERLKKETAEVVRKIKEMRRCLPNS